MTKDKTIHGLGLLTHSLSVAINIPVFTKSIVEYHAQASSITEKVYSMADKITPEVVEQANDLVSRLAEQPNMINGALLGLSAMCAFYHASGLARTGDEE